MFRRWWLFCVNFCTGMCHTFFVLFCVMIHDDVIKWKQFPRYWSFVKKIHRSLVDSPLTHKGQWRRIWYCFFYLRLNKRLSKQSRSRWFETPPPLLSRHYNVAVLFSCVYLWYGNNTLPESVLFCWGTKWYSLLIIVVISTTLSLYITSMDYSFYGIYLLSRWLLAIF